jgi:hypothetical protein
MKVYVYNSFQEVCAYFGLEKEWACDETVHHLFIYFKKAYDLV